MVQNASINTNTKLLFLVVTSILILIVLTNPPIDPDMWWHLKSGQLIWQQKTILTHDQFSFTKLNQPWVNAFWLSDFSIYFLYSVGKFPLLIFAIALLGVFTFLLIYSRTEGPLFIRSFIILLAAISISPEWTARPQVISFFLIGLLDYWLDKKKQIKTIPFFFLPLLFIIWANLHGGFIWGFLLIFARMAGLFIDHLTQYSVDWKNEFSEFKQLLFWTFISIFAILINPNGVAIWKLPFNTIGVSISTIKEWFSPNFHNLEMQPFLWMVLLLIISYSLSSKRESFTNIFKTIGFIYLAFISQRNIPLAIIVITPLIIGRFTDFYSNLKRTTLKPSKPFVMQKNFGSIIINIFIVILLVVTAYGRIYQQISPSLIDKYFPVKALQALKAAHPVGNMFNSYNWGGYLIWSLPEYPVFIDGRADLYGEAIIKEYWSVVNGSDNAIYILDKYHINFIVLEPDWPLIKILKLYQWKVKYQDDATIVMTR